MAFPSQDFLSQEYDDPKDIRNFVSTHPKFSKVEFDMFRLVHVNKGPKQHPVYKFLMDATNKKDITWNFSTVFLVGRDGSVRYRINKPDFEEVEEMIKQLLQEPVGAPSKWNYTPKAIPPAPPPAPEKHG